MSLPLSNLQHLRVGWQKVCDRYNTIAYLTRSSAQPAWFAIPIAQTPKPPRPSLKRLPRRGPQTKKRCSPLGRKSGRRAAQARNELKG
jgi:hypothetical protein